MAKSRASLKSNGNKSLASVNATKKPQLSEASRQEMEKKASSVSSSSDSSSDSEEDDDGDRRSEVSASDDSNASATDSTGGASVSDSASDSDSSASHRFRYNGVEEKSKLNSLTNGRGHVNGTHASSESESDSESDSSQSDRSISRHDQTAGGNKVSTSQKNQNSSSKKSSDKKTEDLIKPVASTTRASTKTAHHSGPTETLGNDSDSSNEGDGSSESSQSDQSESEPSSDEDPQRSRENNTTNKRKSEISESHSAKRPKVDGGIYSKNLFVGNLSWNVDEEWLQREFLEFGEIAGCRIILDRNTGRSKGFGYVEFTNVDDAASALEAKKGALLDGREMNVDFSVPRSETSSNQNSVDRAKERASKFGDIKNNPSDTLWVGNIPFSATAEELQESFGEYGNITRVSLPTDQASGAPKGFGYISFTSVEEASAAFEAMNGVNVNGRSIRLDFATPRTNGDSGSRGGRGNYRGSRGDRGSRGMRGTFKTGRGDFQSRGGRGSSTNRGGIGDFSGKKVTF